MEKLRYNIMHSARYTHVQKKYITISGIIMIIEILK